MNHFRREIKGISQLLAFALLVSMFPWLNPTAFATSHSPQTLSQYNGMTLQSGDTLDLSQYTGNAADNTLRIPASVNKLTIEGNGSETLASITCEGSIDLTIKNLSLNSRDSNGLSSLHFLGASNQLTFIGTNTIVNAGSSFMYGTGYGAAIGVPSGVSLTIDAPSLSDKLAVTGGFEGAAIGSGNGIMPGSIIINGGTLDLTAGPGGTAIGSGGRNDNKTGGSIVINAGEINAISDGIGSAIGGGANVVFGRIEINGGKINAQSSYSDAIGGGSLKGCVDHLIIQGGEIFANSMGETAIHCNHAEISSGSVVVNGAKTIGLPANKQIFPFQVVDAQGTPVDHATVDFGGGYTAMSQQFNGMSGLLYPCLETEPTSYTTNPSGLTLRPVRLLTSMQIAGNDTTIFVKPNEKRQMEVEKSPTVSDESIVWSIEYASDPSLASIDANTGELTVGAKCGILAIRAKSSPSCFSSDASIIIDTPATSIAIKEENGKHRISEVDAYISFLLQVEPADKVHFDTDWTVTRSAGIEASHVWGYGTGCGVHATSVCSFTLRAKLNDESGLQDEIDFSVGEPVESVAVSAAGGVAGISTEDGTLQMLADVQPKENTLQSVTWSIVAGEKCATIDPESGLLTAKANGTVTVRATSDDYVSGVYGEKTISITGQQWTPVSSITVSGAGGASTIIDDGGTLQMNASVLPANATDQNVAWSIVSGAGIASIDAKGLLKASANGSVTVRATAEDGSDVYGENTVIISGQKTDPASVLVSQISISGTGGASAITAKGGTLQMNASVLPANATDQSVVWSIVSGAGFASIDANGFLKGTSNN